MDKIDIFRLDGHALRVFLSVYDTLSVSRTADAFNLNQSTISHTLDKLRAALDDPLFVRAGREIVATERAASLVEQVREIVHAVDALRAENNASHNLSARPVSIACNVTEILPNLRSLRDTIWAEDPEAEIRFLELGSRENLLPLLKAGGVDLAITVQFPAYPAPLTARELGAEPLMVYYDPDQRDPVEDVEAYCAARHAALDFGGARKSVVATALESQSVLRRIAMRAANVHVLGQMMTGTDLVATMQAGLGRHAFAHLARAPAPLHLPEVVFDLVWHRRDQNSPRNTWLREQVIRQWGAVA